MASSGRTRLAAVGAAVLLLLALAVAARPAGAGLPGPMRTPIASTTVPWPRAETIVSLPPSSSARSRIVVSP